MSTGGALDGAISQGVTRVHFYHMLWLIGGCTGDHNGTLALLLIGSRDAHTHRKVVHSLEE